jgi:glycopeptide antibiotics resistance protein
MSPRLLFGLRILLVLLGAAAIAFLALRSSPYLQYIPWMPRAIGVWADSNGILRNVAAFFALGVLIFVFLGRRPIHVLAAIGFGTALEVAQLWIPGRVFDGWDIAASTAGILLAWPVSWLLCRCRKRAPC